MNTPVADEEIKIVWLHRCARAGFQDFLPSSVQVNLHESKRVANDLARSFVVILIVEGVNALGVIRQSERDVSRQRLFRKTIDRIVHRRNFIASGAAK